MNRPTPDPSEEGSGHSSASCPFPSWEGSGVGSWSRGMRKSDFLGVRSLEAQAQDFHPGPGRNRCQSAAAISRAAGTRK